MVFDKLKQLGELKKMRDQAMQIQKALAEEVITVEKNGVKVVITGDQRVQALEIDGLPDSRVKEAVNEAVKKSQEVAAQKFQEMSDGLGGLLGK